ncbi:MAG: hypothetical protein JNK46_07355 [Methylobacteriaceae bacterium]|nr:hypothetical protein [Methylobacteriaceae bacterium]
MTQAGEHGALAHDGAAPREEAAVFRLSPRDARTRIFGEILFAAALIGLSLWHWSDTSLYIIGGVLIWFGLWHGFYQRRIAQAGVDRAPRLVIDAQGVSIPELFGARVPWASIAMIAVTNEDNSTRSLNLIVDDLARHGYTPRGFSRLASAFGRPHAIYDVTELGGDIRAAIHRFAPERLRGPHA